MILSSETSRKSAPPDHAAALRALNARTKTAGWPFACHAAEGFEQPELAAAAALWREMAKGRAMPDRADMTARVMKPFLPQMSLIERVGARYRMRLHGSVLARYAGDGTGKFLEELMAPDRRASYAAICDFVLTRGLPLRVVTQYQAPQISYLMGESLLAPLSVGEEAAMILSVTYARPRSEVAAQAGA